MRGIIVRLAVLVMVAFSPAVRAQQDGTLIDSSPVAYAPSDPPLRSISTFRFERWRARRLAT